MRIHVAHYKAGMNKSEQTSKSHEYISQIVLEHLSLPLVCMFYTHIHI